MNGINIYYIGEDEPASEEQIRGIIMISRYGEDLGLSRSYLKNIDFERGDGMLLCLHPLSEWHTLISV